MEKENAAQKTKKKIPDFLRDVINGIAIGVAFIIPGFSGGSVAAILGIYERLVGAIADIFKTFKKSIITLMPILIGMACGVIALLFPLEAALGSFPFPTVSLFVGLAIGGLPSITDKLRGGFKPAHAVSFALALAAALSLSFLPVREDVNLLAISFGGCLLLILVGMVGSAALIVPGISGSMLLLIFGYYNPIINLATDHILKGRDIPVSLLIFAMLALGIIIGFIAISVIMKKLLVSCPKGTYSAILGFILGSLPTVYISTAKEAGITLDTFSWAPLHILSCVIMLALGVALSLLLIIYAKKSKKQQSPQEENI